MQGPLTNTEVRPADRLEALDREIRSWGRITRSMLQRRLLSLNLEGRLSLISGEERLIDSVGVAQRRKDGEIERVSIRFVRAGIFLEHGVGRGRKAGSPAARASKRVWLGHVLPIAVELLADRLAEGYADIVTAEASIRIPGILETKISR